MSESTSKAIKKIKRPTSKNKVDATLFNTKVEEYLQGCTESNKVPLKTDFCLFVGISHETFRKYKATNSYVVAIKKLELASENAITRKILDENKPIAGIFLLKALFGYSDTQKIDITTNGQALGVVQLPSRAK